MNSKSVQNKKMEGLRGPRVAPLAAASFQLVTLVRNTVDLAGTGEFVTERALDDDRSLGFSNKDIEVECEMVQCSNKDISWEVSVDLANGNKEADDRSQDCVEEQQSFFHELQDHHFERKFISLAEMQDTFFSDRALKNARSKVKLLLRGSGSLKLKVDVFKIAGVWVANWRLRTAEEWVKDCGLDMLFFGVGDDFLLGCFAWLVLALFVCLGVLLL
ncbi:hypothetical protein V6N13_073718 [Hibiscus sabdariffa]|uniref:Uncharacterized protein n=1 Tax=Hibiscus sabdariffa TaxID=183260 RepID=A0ABR2BXT3_9ROSI